MVWIELYKKHYSTEITYEMRKLAEREEYGWRKLFFTNKLKLQLELRRQAKKSTYDDEPISSRRSTNFEDTKSKLRNSKSASRHVGDLVTKSIGSANNKLRFSTFITEN